MGCRVDWFKDEHRNCNRLNYEVCAVWGAVLKAETLVVVRGHS